MTLLNNEDGTDLILGYLNQGRIMDKKRIRAIRKLYGLTQMAFSEVIAVPYKTYQSWELGSRNPSSPAIALLSIAEKEPKVFLKHRLEIIKGVLQYFGK